MSTEAARQNSAGEGPYAVLGFSWDDLREYVTLLLVHLFWADKLSRCHRLQGPLIQASTIFARSSRQQESLAAAMENLDIVPDPVRGFDVVSIIKIALTQHQVPPENYRVIQHLCLLPHEIPLPVCELQRELIEKENNARIAKARLMVEAALKDLV